MINAISDVLTLPTEEMWAAMREAEKNLFWGRDDPSTKALEARAAELTGKEAGLLVPTGTMANLLAVITQAGRGDQVVMEATCHTAWSEEWGLAFVGGVYPRLVKGTRGAMDPADVEQAMTQAIFSHLPRTTLLCLENTHNAAGGAILDPQRTAELCQVAHRHGAAVHIDGARLFNAAVALRVPARVLTEPADSVMFSLNKGLSAPAGAVLCSSKETIAKAHANMKRIGGASFHKAGIYAAAGLVALEAMVDRLAEDHLRAQHFAEGANQVPGMAVDQSAVQTNIVMLDISGTGREAPALLSHLREQGITAYRYDDHTIRFTFHRHISDADVIAMIAALRSFS
jgi:threonine aldolase